MGRISIVAKRLKEARLLAGISQKKLGIKAGIDEGVPTPVLTAALYERFSSRGDADFSNKLLSAMRYEFGGHLEKPTAK